MTKIFYRLEDYFDALAQHPRGALAWSSRSLCTVFGFAGDLFRSRISPARYSPFDVDTAR